MSDSVPKLLIISNTRDRAALYGMLSGAGYRRLVTGDGGDESLELFEELQPDAVVVCVDLDRGDAQALIAAMRDSDRGAAVQIILVGQEQGPIRSALDAMEFRADRFVSRPLAAETLAYAVRTCLEAAASKSSQSAAARPSRRAPTIEQAMDQAIDDFVQNAIASLRTPGMAPSPGAAKDPAAAAQTAARAAQSTLAAASAVMPAGGQSWQAPILPKREPTLILSHAAPSSGAASGGAAHSAAGAAADGAPPPAVPDRPSAADRADAVLQRAQAADAPSGADAYGDLDGFDDLGEAAFEELDEIEDLDDLGDLGDISEIGTSSDLADLEALDDIVDIDDFGTARHAARSEPVRAPAARVSGRGGPGEADGGDRKNGEFADGGPGSSEAFDAAAGAGGGAGADDADDVDDAQIPAAPGASGDFARELRRKMSAMAQRLFPGKQNQAAAVELTHDHAAEIDLASLDVGGGAGVDAPMDSTIDASMDSPIDSTTDAPIDSTTDSTTDAPAAPVADLDPGPTFTGSSPDDSPAVHAVSAASSRPPEPPAVHAVSSSRGVAALPTTGRIRLGETEVATLIARMSESGFTGRLTCVDGDVEKHIHFERGRPVFAASNQDHDRMGQLLVREGKITREQLDQCHDRVAAAGRRIGEVLVESGFLKRRELLPAVRGHVEDIIYSLFSWDAGSYEVTPGDFAASEHIRLSRHPAAMILEGVRRKFGPDELDRLLGPSTSVVETTDDPQRKLVMSVADLSTAERKALSSFDGERDLESIAAQTGLELVTVQQLAYGLIVLGVARCSPPDADAPLPAADEVSSPHLVGETDLAIDRQRVMAKFALVNEADYFALLGVRRDATSFEIKRAYQAARRDYAGERFPTVVRRELSDQIGEINELLEEAYLVLRDEELRASYLANLRD